MKNLKTKLCLASMLVLSACSNNQQPAPSSAAQPEYYTHVIAAQGETLANISKWYTGSAQNWSTIALYNPGLDERRLKIGMQIKIPQNMLTNNKPMPKRAITTANANKDMTVVVDTEKASLRQDLGEANMNGTNVDEPKTLDAENNVLDSGAVVTEEVAPSAVENNDVAEAALRAAQAEAEAIALRDEALREMDEAANANAVAIDAAAIAEEEAKNAEAMADSQKPSKVKDIVNKLFKKSPEAAQPVNPTE